MSIILLKPMIDVTLAPTILILVSISVGLTECAYAIETVPM